MVETEQDSGLSVPQQFGLLGLYALFGVLALFPLSWMRALGAALGVLYYRLASKRVNIVRVNLRLCFPELNDVEREHLVKQSFAHIGMWVFEAGAIWLWSTERILRYIEVANEDVFTDALKNHHGILLAIPHLGNWEILGPYTTRHSEFACFYQHQGQGAVFNEFVRRRRIRNGTVMAPANSSGIRRLYKHLRAGKVAGLLPDHLPSDEMGVFAPFFEKPAFTGTLISSLARKNTAPMLAAAPIRTPRGFKIHFIEVKGQDEKDAVAAATQLNRAIEQCIRLAPEQFQWVYPRFKRRQNSTDRDPYKATAN